MKFDMSAVGQARLLDDRIKHSLYMGLNEASKKTGWVRLSGLPVGIVSGLLSLVTRIALIVECIIKGFGNIIGAAFSDKCNLNQGALNLFPELAKNIIMLPFSALDVVLSPITKTFYMLLKPEAFTEEKQNYHQRNTCVQYPYWDSLLH